MPKFLSKMLLTDQIAVIRNVQYLNSEFRHEVDFLVSELQFSWVGSGLDDHAQIT